MFRERVRVMAVVAALSLLGCPGGGSAGGGSGSDGGGSAGGGGSSASGGGSAGGGSAGGGSAGGGAAVGPSTKAQLRFKRNVRLTAEFAQTLGLPFASVCLELGQYPCTTTVHGLALGGVDPYGSGLYEPIPFSGVTSPIVVDRVALAACAQRATADIGVPGSALIYKDVAALNDAGSEAVKQAVVTLYRRALLRDPTDAEVDHLRQLHRDVFAKGKEGPLHAWATLSCFAVLTSTESLFY